MPAKIVDKKEKKGKYFDKLKGLLDQYPKILLVLCTNIGSNHMQKIRSAIRNEGKMLMGKNTLIRKVIRDHLAKNPELEPLLPYVKGTIGFVFTNSDLISLRDKLVSIKVDGVAKVGSIAPNDVIIPAGNTGLEPTQTSFLQALNIGSKITKGQVEILTDVHLLKKGDKVGQSEAALLAKLNMRPFIYALSIKAVFESGFVYESKMIDMMSDAEFVVGKLRRGIQCIAAASLAISYPIVAAVPHVLSRALSNLVGLSLVTSYTFPLAEKLKAAPVVAAPVAAPVVVKEEEPKKKDKQPEEEKKPAPEEKKPDDDVDLGGGFDIFA